MMCCDLRLKTARCLVVIGLPLAVLALICLGLTAAPGYADPAAFPEDGDRPGKADTPQNSVQPAGVDGERSAIQSATVMIWQNQTLDSAGDVGQHASLAISPFSGSGPRLGISYYDATNGDLKYAVYNGIAWITETVDSAGNVGQYSSLAFYTLVNRKYPRISYYDATNADLKYAYRDFSGWHIQIVDSSGIVGIQSSLQIAPTSPYTQSVSYYDSTNGDLKYAYTTGSGWVIETVDTGGTAAVGGSSSLELLPVAPHYPRISYYDGTNRDLKYASYNGSAWTIDTVDSAGAVGAYTSLSLAPTPPYTPHITYYDNPNANLKHAYYTGSAWNSETVASVGDTGRSSIVAQADDELYVAYEDGNKLMLGYAHYDGLSWITQTADSNYGVGSYPSLGIDSSGALHVAYNDWLNDDLKYARGTACYKLSGASISGPRGVSTGTAYIFTAAVSPTNATLPITYTWQATDQAQVVSVTYATSHTASFNWAATGIKAITVTAQNCGGSIVATHTLAVNSIGLINIPLEVHRLALRHLEEVRGSGQAPNWANAQLGNEARPLYRPDIAGVAYYEFPVVAPAQGGMAAQAEQAAGFIIVSTGEHDFPVPNWATHGLPPSRRMEQRAAGEGETAVKFYKLDALAYVAENALEAQIATDGAQPPKIIGMNPAWLDNPPPSTEVDWEPSLPITDDAQAGVITYTQFISGPTGSPITLTAWSSWNEVKTGYGASYGVLAEALRREASEQWLAEENSRDYGRTLLRGQVITEPLLWQGPTLAFDGIGLSYIVTQVIARPDLPPALRIVVTDAARGRTTPFTVTVTYPNSYTEHIRFLIFDLYQTYLPVIARVKEEFELAGNGLNVPLSVQGSSEDDTEDQDSSEYQYWYVGPDDNPAAADADQCWYAQMGKNDPINGADCYSGCGPTAWTMLFGWADNKAASGSGNPLWGGRWGIYRANGGRGNDVVAPKQWDDPYITGVKNVMEELRVWVLAFCSGGQGATYPGFMTNANYYLEGRTAVDLTTVYNAVGFKEASIRRYARNVIKNPSPYDRPSVIGIGWLSHYPLAYGYRSKSVTTCQPCGGWGQSPCCSSIGCVDNGQTCRTMGFKNFYVNQGWGGSSGEWTSADIWFAGRITPPETWTNDVALYRTYNRRWYYDYNHNGSQDAWVTPWGWPQNVRPVVGDFDRNHMLDDIGVYVYASDYGYEGTWKFSFHHQRTTSAEINTPWNDTVDVYPVALDYDRDGYVDDIGVYDPSTNRWSFDIDYNGTKNTTVDWVPGVTGNPGLPITGDFDRDGYVDDLGLYVPSNNIWYYDYNHNGTKDAISGPWGLSEDLPVAGDFDMDGYIDDVALYRPSTHMWYYDHNHDVTSTNWHVDELRGPFGLAGDLPIAGNFDVH